MRYKISGIDLLKSELAKLNDGRELPWNSFPCLEWPRGNRGRYGVTWTGDRHAYVHRLAYELTFGAIPDGFYVCHRCDNPICFRPSHLFAGTNSDNIKDCVQKGRFNKPAGERHYNARLTREQVELIRALADDGFRREDLAREFGVTGANISHILVNRSWKGESSSWKGQPA